MRRQFWVLCLLLLTVVSAFGQQSSMNLITSKQDSIAYFSQIESLRKQFLQAEKEKNNPEIQRLNTALLQRLQVYNLYAESLDFSQRALNVALVANDTLHIIDNYLSICKIFIEKENYAKAESYINKCNAYLAAFPSYPNKKEVYLKNVHISLRYSNKNMIQYNELLREIGESTQDLETLINVENNYFAYYYLLFRESNQDHYHAIIKKHIDKALAYALQYNNHRLIATVYNNYAVYYEAVERNINKALPYYVKAIASLEKTPNYYQNNFYQSITENYAYALFLTENFAASSDYSLRSLEALKEVYSMNMKQKMDELESKFLLNNQQKKFDEEQRAIQQKHEKTSWIYLIALLALSICIIIVYMYFQNKRLVQENKIQLLKREKQEEILVATLDAQNEERHRIASVLHDHVSALLASANMQLQAFAFKQDEVPQNISSAMKNLANSHQKVRDLSHELVPIILTKFGLTNALMDLCDSFSNENMRFECDSSLGDCRYTTEFELKVYYMLSELMNNALRHSQAQDVSVHMWEMNEQLHLIVSDNGVGMTPEMRTNPNGIGMLQLNARVKNLGGTIQIEDNQPGTHFEITLPVQR